MSEDIYKPSQDDCENGDAEKCECCGRLDYLEFMHSKPDGYYCESCYLDIFE